MSFRDRDRDRKIEKRTKERVNYRREHSFKFVFITTKNVFKLPFYNNV